MKEWAKCAEGNTRDPGFQAEKLSLMEAAIGQQREQPSEAMRRDSRTHRGMEGGTFTWKQSTETEA